jgi:DNA polymerase elongation subunit (family B)
MRLATKERVRILDFDIEVRPMAFYGGDFVTKQPTAIAWKWIGERSRVEVRLVGESFDTRQTMAEEVALLEEFRQVYLEADIVTGHYIRGFDLPVLNARMMRHGLPMLETRLAQDTKGDLAKAHGVSKSQENLGAMFELRHPKVGMNTTKWELGNALTSEGLAETRKRVVGDVRQHIEMRRVMLERGYLAPRPKAWSPGAHGPTAIYVP